MARTKTKARGGRSRVAAFAWGDHRVWRHRGLYASAATIALSAALVFWHPPALSRLLDPVWRFGGVALFFVPTWATVVYIATRASPMGALRHWQWWISSLLLLGALASVPNAAGGMSIGYTPLHSDFGEFVSGGSGLGGWLRLLTVIGISFTVVFPRLVAAAFAGTATGAEKLYDTASQRALEARERRRAGQEGKRSHPVIVDGSLPKEGGWESENDDIQTFDKADELNEEVSSGPRIVLPPSADLEEELEPAIVEENDSDFDGVQTEESLALESIAAGVPSAADPGEERPALDDPFAMLPDVHWTQPPLEMFTPEPDQEIDHEAQLETAVAIESTLSEYNIEATVTEVRPGPTVTLFGLRPGWIRRFKETKEKDATGNQTIRREEVSKTRVKVDRIAALDRDLALHLKAPSIRIDSPILGTNLVGIEVPNADPQAVHIRTLLESDAFRRLRGRTKLGIPLGKGSGGEPVVADLSRMPHLLIAGATGSGKSVFVNAVITSLLWHSTPNDVRMILIDPKRVELSVYNGIPHLITPVIVENNKSLNALRWLTMQMDERLRLLSDEGVRDIASYNEKNSGRERLPYLVLVIDELADLMMTSGKSFEQALVRLAQMGRATGIHLVVATQRPSVDVITGLIKANFPTRVSFMVTALVDSRTILDTAGAEKLLGRGDMLYLPQDAARPARIQSAFLSEEEATEVARFWRGQANGYEPPELPELLVPEELLPKGRGTGANRASAIGDPTSMKAISSTGDVEEAARELAELYDGKISTSLLQRRLGVGYPRAARLRDLLVEEGLASAEIPNAPVETKGRGRRAAKTAALNDSSDEAPTP